MSYIYDGDGDKTIYIERDFTRFTNITMFRYMKYKTFLSTHLVTFPSTSLETAQLSPRVKKIIFRSSPSCNSCIYFIAASLPYFSSTRSICPTHRHPSSRILVAVRLDQFLFTHILFHCFFGWKVKGSAPLPVILDTAHIKMLVLKLMTKLVSYIYFLTSCDSHRGKYGHLFHRVDK